MRRLAVGLLALAAACRPDCTPPAGADPPNVLLVTVDTFRADHVGTYGSRRSGTPHLDRLAAEGVRFADAYSAANVTVPSHVSILTSRPLASHGVLSNHVETAEPVDALPARFAAAGYRTGAFVSSLHLGPTLLLGHLLTGLERFEGPERASAPLRAEETTDRLLAWLRGACRGPVFAWAHLWDPHMPYAPPRPFDRAYYDGDPRDRRHTSMDGVELDWVLHDLSPARDRLQRHPRAVRSLKSRLGVNSRAVRKLVLYPDGLAAQAPAEALPDLFGLVRPIAADLHRSLPFNRTLAGFLEGVRDVEYPRALYAGEISYVDQEIGRLRDTLDAWGLAHRTILVVTGDHGEGLGDHGVYFNHIGLFDEMLRVPLIVWAPGRLEPAVRRDPTSGLDVAPTILALAGLTPGLAMEGRDLLAGAEPSRLLVSEAVKGVQITVRDGPWKLVRTLQPYWVNDAFHPRRGDVDLYDLANDPTERVNRAATDPEVTRDLAARLDAWMAAHGLDAAGSQYQRPSAPVSPAARERLRALGYAE
jgi:arylsulfatase A-like enzyme